MNFACFCGYLPSARALIDSGCSVDAQSLSVKMQYDCDEVQQKCWLKGETPLMAACQNDDFEIIKLLSSEGCNLFLRDNVSYSWPNHLACV